MLGQDFLISRPGGRCPEQERNPWAPAPLLDIRDLAAEGLRVDSFAVRPGEAWCLIGGNSSGLARFGDVITGEEAACRAGLLHLPDNLGVLSCKRQQALFEAELLKDDTDFLNRIDPGTPARDFLTDPEGNRDLIEHFALDKSLDRGYRQLSSGQSRKLCLLQQITRGASFLVLEDPYAGLDQASCRELDRVLAGLHEQGLTVLALVNNFGDIPPWTTHLGVFRDGTLSLRGRADEMQPAVQLLFGREPALFQVSVEELRRERQPAGACETANLVTLRRGFARYGEVEVFRDLDLTVNQGDHTLITGPNGCGKSTLLQIITGDHPLCYVNDLTIFGRQRGSGESVWDLKKEMGIVSSELHRNHRVSGSALSIVLSGLFDSIGLYVRPSVGQQQRARRWLQRLGLAGQAATPFRRLSFGEQRLILLARALIKVPRLLVLDEPTQGLDAPNRMALLDLLAEIAADRLCTILYVSHRHDEYRSFFTKRVRFD